MGDKSTSSISGDGLTIAFGAPGANFGAGLVFLYSKSGDTVTYTGELAPTGGSGIGQRFGSTAALNLLGKVLVVGSPDDGDEGYVYVFDKLGGTWSQTARFRPTDTASSKFGNSVAVSDDGNVMVAGSYTTDSIGVVSMDIVIRERLC
jgi:hypothetical protein